MSETDLELLARYTGHQAEDAFAEMVRRHLNLVYSAALRQVHSPQLAQEVAQSTFIKLAQQAHRLAPDSILSAWLYQVTRREAVDVVRREVRRQLREQVATEMNAMNAPSTDWTHVEPLLDEAMHALDETDRTAVLLRYFENKSLREVGQALGASDDAAQKRVSRAVERLREFFTSRGVTVGASGLVLVISANAVQSAPAGLAVTISAAVSTAASTIVTVTATATKTIAMTTLQKSLIAASAALLAGAGIYQARQASAFRTEVQALREQQSPLTDQIAQANNARDEAQRQVASLREENERLNLGIAELPKLRGELAQLKNDSQELAKLKAMVGNDETLVSAASWKDRVNRLKQRLEQTPEAKIPELQLLSEKDWLNAAKGELETDADYRRALSTLRGAGENKMATMLKTALSRYIQANDNSPSDLAQLQPYFDSPVDPAMLQRWEIAPAATVKSLGMGGDMIITQKAPVDDVFDTRYGIGPNGYGSTDFLSRDLAATMDPLWDAYKTAHNGNWPEDVSELKPYVITPEQKLALDKLILKNSVRK